MNAYPFSIIADSSTHPDAHGPDWDELEVCTQVESFFTRAMGGAPIALVTTLSSCVPLAPGDLVARLLVASITRLCIVYESGWPGVLLTDKDLTPGVDSSLRIVKAALPTTNPRAHAFSQAGGTTGDG